MEKAGIYIHIPFCKKKCEYCDFISFSNKQELVENYINALIFDIKKSSDKLKLKKVDTIYFGGGTPSYVESKYIIKILDILRNSYSIEKKCEITIEINPGTADKEKLFEYKRAGINRLSIGLQSTHNRLLKLIGRVHTYEDFLEVYNMSREIGFNNINIDLMEALPTQSLSEIVSSVKEVISLNPEHISLYSLILEERTKIFERIKSGELKNVDEKLERKMYWNTKYLLEQSGYEHYEISNFSKNGFESRHNLNCWSQEEYLGFGIASHSYLNDKRFSRISNLERYIKNIEECNFEANIQIEEIQNRENKAKEYMLLGFRKLNGISISEFERRFQINPLFYFRFEINRLEKEDLIEVDLDNIKLTKKGLDFANLVFEEFI